MSLPTPAVCSGVLSDRDDNTGRRKVLERRKGGLEANNLQIVISSRILGQFGSPRWLWNRDDEFYRDEGFLQVIVGFLFPRYFDEGYKLQDSLRRFIG